MHMSSIIIISVGINIRSGKTYRNVMTSKYNGRPQERPAPFLRAHARSPSPELYTWYTWYIISVYLGCVIYFCRGVPESHILIAPQTIANLQHQKHL